MDTDDLEPPPKRLDKLDLQIMSLEQLSEYIAELEVKRDARGAADSVFKV